MNFFRVFYAVRSCRYAVDVFAYLLRDSQFLGNALMNDSVFVLDAHLFRRSNYVLFNAKFRKLFLKPSWESIVLEYGRGGQPVRDQEPQSSMCCCKEPRETRRHTCTEIICLFMMIVYISFVFNHLIIVLSSEWKAPGKPAFTEEPHENQMEIPSFSRPSPQAKIE